MLRIAYRRRINEDAAMAEARVKAMAALLQDAWKRDGAAYHLTIETEVYADRAAQK